MRRSLSALLAPVRQFLDEVGIELPGQARDLPLPVASGPWQAAQAATLASGTPSSKIFLSRGDVFFWRAAEGRRIERSKVGGERRDHRRAQHMRNVGHDVVRPPAFNKCPQLVLDVLGLLSGEPRDRIKSAIALSRRVRGSLGNIAVLLRTRPSEQRACRCCRRVRSPRTASARIAACSAQLQADACRTSGVHDLGGRRRPARTPRYDSHSFMIPTEKSLQIADIGRDGFDLLFVQAVRDRLHDGRRIRV